MTAVDHPVWLALGLLGNAAFFLRFLIQWLASERARTSTIPRAFWHLYLHNLTRLRAGKRGTARAGSTAR